MSKYSELLRHIRNWKPNAWVVTRGLPDPFLQRIDQIITKGPQGKDPLPILCDLYFVVDAALKKAQVDPKSQPAQSRGRLQELFSKLCGALAEKLDCKEINVLPREIEKTFGRGLSAHGVSLDYTDRSHFDGETERATRLSEYHRKLAKVQFFAGLAHRVDEDGRPKELLDTTTHQEDRSYRGIHKGKQRGMEYVSEFGDAEHLNWHEHHAGYVLCMGRDFYVAKHDDVDLDFHSQYFGAIPVQCSGTIRVEKGVVKEISNDSGHFRPTPAHLVSALQALLMHGVAIINVKVFSDQSNKEACVTGQEFLETHDTLRSLRRRQRESALHHLMRIQGDVKKIKTELWSKYGVDSGMTKTAFDGWIDKEWSAGKYSDYVTYGTKFHHAPGYRPTGVRVVK